MRQKLLCSILICLPILGFAQNVNINILPFINATTSIKDGLIEAGPELSWGKTEKGKIFTLRPTFRMPLTNKTENVLQVDRFSSTWRSILGFQCSIDATQESGNISNHSFSGQFEYGYSNFKFYPMGNKTSEQNMGRYSYSVEGKYIGFFTKGSPGAKHISPQFRLRYSNEWKASSEVGVVNTPNSNGVTTTTNMIIALPSMRSTFSPAFSIQIYPGKGSYSYSPAIYCDFTGKKGIDNPFNNLNRLRLEGWVFFYPMVKDNPNVKIGISPFLSIRTAGTDDYNKIEYGGVISIRFGTTFLQFL